MATNITTTPAGPPAASADRGAPGGYVASPHTLLERLRFLREDAERILAQPESYRTDELQWARVMVATSPSPPVRIPEMEVR
jgi:hypothetical protein